MSETEYKKYVDDYITNNYIWLEKLTANVAIRLTNENNIDSNELISDVYMYLYTPKVMSKIITSETKEIGRAHV